MLREEPIAGGDVGEPLQAAEVASGPVTVMLSLDDVEELEGLVAASTKHGDDRKLEGLLDRSFERLHQVMA